MQKRTPRRVSIFFERLNRKLRIYGWVRVIFSAVQQIRLKMKRHGKNLQFIDAFGIVSLGLAGLSPSHAQTLAADPTSENSEQISADFDANLKTLEATTPTSASALPESGLFYSAKHANWPPFPANVLGLDAWPLDTNVFVLDDLSFSTAGRSRIGGGVKADDDSGPPSPLVGGGSGSYTNSIGDSGATPIDPQGLWLQITGMTNPVANLVIHPGTTNSDNATYDLLYCTNLASPISWQWVARTLPGQTNINVTNATDPQGFYRASLYNDFTANDSLGTDFWVGLPSFNNAVSFSLYISSPLGATGTVAIPELGITNAFLVAARGVTNIGISSDAMMDYNVVETNGIHVTASQSVSVYAVDYSYGASTAFTCYPTPLLGTNYCIMAHDGSGIGNSEFAIVATTDDTTVTCTPSLTAGFDSIVTNLQQGENFQIGPSSSDDVTGSWITSDKPLAVFAGAQLTHVPDAYDFGNPVIQEQLPVNNWGTQALALSFAGRANGDTYRVLAAYSNTVVTITGTFDTTNGDGNFTGTTNSVWVVTNEAGQFNDVLMEGPVEFQGSQPIQVAHFANGTAWDNLPGEEGDPCEILLPPVGCYLETNTVFTLTYNPTNNAFSSNYISLIIAQSATNNTYVDGTNKITNFEMIGSSGYYGSQFFVTNSGTHTVTSSQPVGVEVYGWGFVDAYGYFGGVVK